MILMVNKTVAEGVVINERTAGRKRHGLFCELLDPVELFAGSVPKRHAVEHIAPPCG